MGVSYNDLRQDQILLLACEYFVSDFRASASSLEFHLESLKPYLQDFSRDILEIQERLLSSIQMGNKKLHLHAVSEPSTTTSEGDIMNLSFHLADLLKNVSADRNRDIVIPSLQQQLIDLKMHLNGIKI